MFAKRLVREAGGMRPEGCVQKRVSRDPDSGKMGTDTSLNCVVCGEQHHEDPLI
jgi:hypothetical protein